MNQQLIIIDGESLLALLTNYYDGLVPLDAKLRSFGVSKYMQRWLGLEVESDQWPLSADIGEAGDGQHPLLLRYEGKKIMNWSKADGHDPVWHSDYQTPKKQ